MVRFRIARLLGFALSISVMTGSIALPAMAAEETATVVEAAQETGSGGDGSDGVPGTETVSEEDAEETASEENTSEENTSEEKTSGEETAKEETSGGTEETAKDDQTVESAEEGGTGGSAIEEETAENADPSVNAEGTDGAAEEEEETLPVSDAAEDLSADVPVVTAEALAEVNIDKKEVEQTYDVELSTSASEVMIGKTDSLTAKISFTADSEETFEERAAAAIESLSWGMDETGAAEIAQISEAQTQKSSNTTEAGQNAEETGQSGAEEVTVLTGVITQTATIMGLKEGTSCVTLQAGEESLDCKVTVRPVPTVLGNATDLNWKDTTVLTWDKVTGAEQYRVVVSVCEGTTKYAGVKMVNSTACDLEDKIVALIRAHKSALTGASYSVKATVQAINTDTVHYANGAVVSAPGIRYLQTTYQEALSRNGWFQKGGEWYFYEAGVKQTGWFNFDGKKYYLYADGSMAHDCWVGTRYMKSGGEMAKNEWVDDYKYYVDSTGKRVNNSIFRAGNFVKTSKGWRYVRANGRPDFKNVWVSIFNRMYYFDANGYIKTGFFTVNGKKYFSNYSGTLQEGLGVRRTGWVNVGSGSYWFDDSGVMQTSTWVDKKQHYVDAKGRQISWITYNNLRNVNTSNRLGYYINSSNSAPEQSIAAYNAAYKAGNKIMVIDLRYTKDNVPVCFHDDVVGYARYKNGNVPGTKPTVSKSTLSQLNQYDYGIKWGNQYKGTGVLTLEAMAKWIASHPDTELYIEVKAGTMNATQIKNTVAILNKYKIVNNSSMVFSTSSTSDTRAQRVHNAAPTLRIGITTSSINNVSVDQIKKAKGANNDVFLWCWGSTALSAAKVNTLRSLDVQYECGTFSTLDEILSYYAKGNTYIYNTGVETTGAVFHQLLRTATMHEKAKWVETSNGWMYKFASGNYARSRWVTVGGKNYYFTKDAIMKTGWLSQNGNLYYLKSDGAMAIGNTTINGHVYQFAANGVFVKKIK